jgi:putative SOS response-associated peptidase YedK
MCQFIDIILRNPILKLVNAYWFFQTSNQIVASVSTNRNVWSLCMYTEPYTSKTYRLAKEYQEYMSKSLGSKDLKWKNSMEYHPNFNASPTTNLPVLVLNEDKNFELITMRWGLIPSYAKTINSSLHTHNARGEGVTDSIMYKRLLSSHRCVSYVNGYYEWQHGTKIPHYITRKDKKLICFASMCDHWEDDAQKIDSFTFLTIEPNKDFLWLHDRMPVMLNEEERDEWLNPSNRVKDILHLIKPVETDLLDIQPVSNSVNISSNNIPDCIKPIPKKVTLDKWFKRKVEHLDTKNDEKLVKKVKSEPKIDGIVDLTE